MADMNNPSFVRMIRTLFVVTATGIGFGIVMAAVSSGFVRGVEFAGNFRTDAGFFTFEIAGWTLQPVALVSLFVAAGLVLLVRRVFRIGRWHGPADSIHAAHRTDNELDVKSGFGSTLAAFISASGGASVGQYGPLVHFGATMGSFIRHKTGGILSTDIFIGCGVAGAIAAGFNAPIAGVIFAHEAILRHFSLRAIAPIAIASITAVWVRSHVFEAAPLFTIDSSSADVTTLLPAALIAGPFFGLLAVLFMVTIRYSTALAKATKWSQTTLILVAAMAMGTLATIIPETLGLGTATMQQMMNGEFPTGYLVLVLIGKLLATAICLGFGFFGGVFSPALFVGLTAGALGGRLLGWLGLMAAGPGVAICGMAAVASAVIGAPIAGVLIILEMTLSYEFALAAMLSVVVSTLVSNLIFGHSFFDRQLLDRGIDVTLGRGHIEMMESPVSKIVSDDYVAIAPTASVEEAIKQLADSAATEGYVVFGDGRFAGKVSLHQLIGKTASISIKRYADKEALSIKHDSSLQQAIEVASDFVGESIPIINRDTEEFLGVVTEADLFQLYLSLQNRISDLERA